MLLFCSAAPAANELELITQVMARRLHPPPVQQLDATCRCLASASTKCSRAAKSARQGHCGCWGSSHRESTTPHSAAASKVPSIFWTDGPTKASKVVMSEQQLKRKAPAAWTVIPWHSHMAELLARCLGALRQRHPVHLIHHILLPQQLQHIGGRKNPARLSAGVQMLEDTTDQLHGANAG